MYCIIIIIIIFIFIAIKSHILCDQDLRTILEKLHPYSSKWRNIGEGLGFTSSELDNIQAAPLRLLSAPQSYLSAMLADWLQWAPGDARGSKEYANKNSLVKAVDTAGLGRTAQELSLVL